MASDKSMNIDTDEFVPAKSSKNKQNKAGKKRTLSSTIDIDEEQMQIDDATGIEGARKSAAVTTKRKKFTNAEIRKVAVPPHRFVSFLSYLNLHISHNKQT